MFQQNQKDSDVVGALPAYVQISEVIAREISAGRLLDGERLPPERVMAKDYDVAVGTLRKALDLLASQGLLERRQGSGNYIQARAQSATVYAFFRLELLTGGGLPTARLLSVDKMQKPKGFPDFGSSESGFRFRRLRFLDRHAVALEEIWLDADRVDEVDRSSVSESLYHYYKSKLGFWITRADDRVSVAPAPDWGVEQFAPSPKTYVGYIERIAFDQNGESAEYSRNWYDPKLANYVSRLK